MKWFYNLKTGIKLGLGFGMCLVLALIIGTTALSRMALMNQEADKLSNGVVVSMRQMLDLVRDARQLRQDEYRHILATDKESRGRLEGEMQTEIGKAQTDLDAYEKTIDQPEDRTNFEALKNNWQAFLSVHNRGIAIGRSDDMRAARLYMRDSRADFASVSDQLDKMVEWNTAEGERLDKSATHAYTSGRILVIGLLIVAALAGLTSAWFITRQITGTLAQVCERLISLRSICIANLGRAVEALARGDLTATIQTGTQPLEIESKDELGVMAEQVDEIIAQTQATVASFEQAQGSLRALIGEVAHNAEGVASTSQQLSASADQTAQATNDIARSMQEVSQASEQSARASQEMAQGSEQQARSASEAAAAMDLLQRAVRSVEQGGQVQHDAALEADSEMSRAFEAMQDNLRISQSVGKAVEETQALAQEGAQSVHTTVVNMERIQANVNESVQRVKKLGEMGQQIGAIVQAIDEIAEQTNLLALNAAIEAARAGEHGRGFAVVADEVRKLAERSSSATKEIATLIGNVRSEVEQAVDAMAVSEQAVTEGVEVSHQTGGALEKILEGAKNSAALMEEAAPIVQGVAQSLAKMQAVIGSVREGAEGNLQTATEMAAGSEQVSTAIASVAAISEETAAGAEEMSASAQQVSASAQNVSAAVEEQTASMQEVNAAANELAGMATRMQELVRQFKMEQERRDRFELPVAA